MADLRRAEKLASAKKKLKQFQQKNRDSQSESGRSTPCVKKLDDEDKEDFKLFQGENGGSTNSLSQSENLSSNISGTDSPMLRTTNSTENLCQMQNGNSQPDLLNITDAPNSLPKVSETLFKSTSPQSFINHSLPPSSNTQSGSDFFDSLSSATEPPDRPLTKSSLPMNPALALNMAVYQPSVISSSTPDGPKFQETPNYSFPDVSVSPINDIQSNNPAMLGNELESKLKYSLSRNSELEQQIGEQKTQIVQLQSHLEEAKKKLDEQASTLKHQVQAIEILVSEKTELQSVLDKRQEEINSKTGEMEELQSRLRASRHRVTDLEQKLNSMSDQLTTQQTTLAELTSRYQSLLKQHDNQGKLVGDLELQISDLKSKLDFQNQTLNALSSELQDKTSQLSLAEVRIQQLSCGQSSSEQVDDLHLQNEELSKKLSDVECQLKSEVAIKEESLKEYQNYVNRLQNELHELKVMMEKEDGRVEALTLREQQLVQQVSELERQLQRVPQQTVVIPQTDTELQSLRVQLQSAAQASQQLQTQLDNKSYEVEALREGLLERALRIQELERSVERLENERPDSANLQAAIESDKVAASRAIAQNNNLKRQLEELQEAVVQLNNSKMELTEKLQHEHHLNRDLAEQLQKSQVSPVSELEKAQQTDLTKTQESESQTTYTPLAVSPEAMVKLEEKFRKTMGELADLSDEKQRLEHLVMQLQSETDTIGEYITLYQLQRGMLRQRAQEKEEQVVRLAQDKETLRNKLSQLNCLVQRLVGAGASEYFEQHHINGFNQLQGTDVPLEPKEDDDTAVVPTSREAQTTDIETAQQIRSLLTEIGSSNLVATASGDSNINFHPCPWCSGRLITV